MCAAQPSSCWKAFEMGGGGMRVGIQKNRTKSWRIGVGAHQLTVLPHEFDARIKFNPRRESSNHRVGPFYLAEKVKIIKEVLFGQQQQREVKER